jgi:hypothetical protein
MSIPMSDSADARRGAIADGWPMTYVMCTTIPDGDLDGFMAIEAKLPAAPPEGLLARYVGVGADGLVITAVWSSKADSDRFFAEHLGPVVREVHGERPPTGTTIAYDAADVLVPAAASTAAGA